MESKEWETASLFKVVEVTLDEYAEECEQMGRRVDKCGYISQILEKAKHKIRRK